MSDEIYDRQIQAFGRAGQEKIASTRIGIVGLGGLGSQIAVALAYLGATSFVLVDDDRVEASNLNRLIGATPADAHDRSYKADVLARFIHAVNPTARVDAIRESLRSRPAIDAVRGTVFTFGAVDTDSARLVLTEVTAAYKIILIDSASEVLRDETGHVNEFGGRVVISRPGEFCLDCAGQIDLKVASAELKSQEARETALRHGYGVMPGRRSPSVAAINGVVANLAVVEFLAMITQIREPFRHVVYYGMRARVNVRSDSKRADCYVCDYLVGRGDAANVYRFAIDGG